MLNHSNAKSQSSKEYFPFVKVLLYLFPFSHYFFWEIENFHLKNQFFFWSTRPGLKHDVLEQNISWRDLSEAETRSFSKQLQKLVCLHGSSQK